MKITKIASSIADAFGIVNLLRTKKVDPQKAVNYFYFGRNAAGITVTAETALQCSVIWACVMVIAKAIASSDWLVYMRLPNGDREALPDDPLSYVLNVRPNPDMTAQSFKTAIMMAALLHGNGYAEIERDMANRVAYLHLIHPDRVTLRRGDDGELLYEVRNDDGSVAFVPASDMYHIRGPSLNGLAGDSTIYRASHAIALAMAQERFSEAYFGNNTQLGGILEYSGQIDEPTYDRLKEQWNKRHQGANKAFNVAFIDNGMKWHPIDVFADKAQLSESREYQVVEICRFYGIPPHKVQHLKEATFSNIEHLGMEFSRDGLRPWARELQQEADYKLFSKRGPPRFTLLDLEWASQGDFKTRAEGYQIMRNAGVYSTNDILKKEGQNTIGKDGDVRIVNGAMVKLEDVGKMQLAKQTGGAPESQGDVSRNPTDRSAKKAVLTTVYARVQSRVDNHKDDLKRRGVMNDETWMKFVTKQVPLLDELLGPAIEMLWTNGSPSGTRAAIIEGGVQILERKMTAAQAADQVLTYLGV